MNQDDDFYEDDQPAEEVIAAWNRGAKSLTAPPCDLPTDPPPGVLWRCECGRLWQMSVARECWVYVTPEDDALFALLFDPIPLWNPQSAVTE